MSNLILIEYAKESYKIYKAEGGTEVFKELEEIINIIEVEEIKNNIITAHDTNTGEYYIELIGEYEGSYILDINNVEGNPYKLNGNREQFGIFELDGTNFTLLISSLISSTPLLDAASISITSGFSLKLKHDAH